MRHRTEPLPPWALAGRSAALAAFDRGDDGTAVARLTEETVPTPVAHRSAGAHDVAVAALRFEHEDLTVHLRVHADGRLRRVSGLAAGECDHAVLRVRRSGAARHLRIGGDGAFTLSGLPRGPVSLCLRRAGHPPVVTEWFTI